MSFAMSSSRPYIIRALYEWMVDNEATPYLLVDAHGKDVVVPQNFVSKEGQIVLNISPSAVRDLLLDNEGISFNARFGGVPMQVYVPCGSVLGIYARENGQGMIFEPEERPEPPPGGGNDGGGDKESPSRRPDKRPSLRVVK